VSAAAFPAVVVWHDVECGAYTADLALWRELAQATWEAGPVLEIGAGTGRVSLDLARRGFEVTALDRDPELLAELEARAAAEGLRVATARAGAEDFQLGGSRFGLVVAPMQVVQLLADRPAFLVVARRHLAPGGLVAMAIAANLEGFDPADGGGLPLPDRGVRGAWRFVSQPVAVRELPGRVRIERVRVAIAPDGTRERSDDAIELRQVDRARLVEEGRAAGLEPTPARRIEETDEHVASEVVVLRG
jgi:SAM-dependent methyltransferase